MHYLDIVDCNGGDHHKAFATNFNPEINIREITQKGKYYHEGEVAQASLKDPSFTLPIKVSSFLQSILPNFANEEALVIFNNKQVEVRFGTYNVVSQVSVLDFPNYNGLLPDSMTYMIEISVESDRRHEVVVNLCRRIDERLVGSVLEV